MKIVATDYTKGEIMKIVREWTELTQRDFGKRIGKSEYSVKDYECEKTNYGIDTLLKAAKEFGLKITIEKKK